MQYTKSQYSEAKLRNYTYNPTELVTFLEPWNLGIGVSEPCYILDRRILELWNCKMFSPEEWNHTNLETHLKWLSQRKKITIPTDPCNIFKPQHQEVGKFRVVQEGRANDFKAPKLLFFLLLFFLKVRSPYGEANAPGQGERVSQMDTPCSQPSYSSTYHFPEGFIHLKTG